MSIPEKYIGDFVDMSEPIKEKIKRYSQEGYVDIPAYMRAIFWFVVGIIFLGLVSK